MSGGCAKCNLGSDARSIDPKLCVCKKSRVTGQVRYTFAVRVATMCLCMRPTETVATATWALRLRIRVVASRPSALTESVLENGRRNSRGGPSRRRVHILLVLWQIQSCGAAAADGSAQWCRESPTLRAASVRENFLTRKSTRESTRESKCARRMGSFRRIQLKLTSNSSGSRTRGTRRSSFSCGSFHHIPKRNRHPANPVENPARLWRAAAITSWLQRTTRRVIFEARRVCYCAQ